MMNGQDQGERRKTTQALTATRGTVQSSCPIFLRLATYHLEPTPGVVLTMEPRQREEVWELP